MNAQYGEGYIVSAHASCIMPETIPPESTVVLFVESEQSFQVRAEKKKAAFSEYLFLGTLSTIPTLRFKFPPISLSQNARLFMICLSGLIYATVHQR